MNFVPIELHKVCHKNCSKKSTKEISRVCHFPERIGNFQLLTPFSRSSKDLVVSSSPLARIGSERRDDDDTEGSIEIIDGGEKVKLRRCLSVPQLDHLTRFFIFLLSFFWFLY